MKIETGLESLKAVLGEITKSMIDINIKSQGYKAKNVVNYLDRNMTKFENTNVEKNCTGNTLLR